MSDDLHDFEAARLEGVSLPFLDRAGQGTISLSVDVGTRLTVFGPPGAGKSVLLRVLAGCLDPAAGEVRCRSAILVEQAPHAPGRHTVRQSLVRRLRAEGMTPARAGARAAVALERMALEHLAEVPEKSLTPVERMAVHVAWAAATESEVLLLDDVTSSLPEPWRRKAWEILDDERGLRGLAIVHATCCSSEAETADQVLVLDGGIPLAVGRPDDLLRQYAAEEVLIEAAEAGEVQHTLRGIFDVRMVETAEGLRCETAEGCEVAAHVFRHPAGGARVVLVRRGDLWKVFERLRAAAAGNQGGA